MLETFVGRQPIFDRRLEVIGYEILFRGFDSEHATFADGDRATSRVLLNAFIDIGLDQLVGNNLAFINFTRGLLLEQRSLLSLDVRMVIEVLEDVDLDEEMIEVLRSLSGAGYHIALDDVVDPQRVVRLLDSVDIVKLDILAIDRDHLAQHAATLQKQGVKMLAEKVETLEEFNLCRDLGFDYFQGYFLCRPKVVVGQRMPADRQAILLLLARLQDPDLEFDEMAGLVQKDVSLSYKLMRLINSAYYAMPTRVNSIRQALTLLGTRQVQAWVSLLLLSQIDDKPRELMTIAAIRARMCELLALASGVRSAEAYFTVGLFSVLDALLDLPMQEVLSSLPLSDKVADALFHYEGHMGAVLACAQAYERGNWDDVYRLGLDPALIRDTYLEALRWVRMTSPALTSSKEAT